MLKIKPEGLFRKLRDGIVFVTSWALWYGTSIQSTQSSLNNHHSKGDIHEKAE